VIGRVFIACVWSCAVVLAAIGPAEGGEPKAVPPVKVVPPAAGSGAQVKIERDDLPPPQLEVAKHPAQVPTPVIPAFELPATEPGFHGARELRVRGKALLGTEIRVKGFVTALYDCVDGLATANPHATREQIQAAIRGDASLCDRTLFWMGDAHDTARDASIAVIGPPIGAPRPAMPRIALGDYMAVTGTWAPDTAAERGADPVLRFAAAERAVPPPSSPPPELVAAPKSIEIEIDAAGQAPMRKFVDDVTLNASLDHLNTCNKALAGRHYDDAIAACREATQVWDGNHLAWYAWAGAHLARSEWLPARIAIERAVALRPDLAMYQLYLGIALYETERQRAREVQARRDRKKPDDVDVDPTALKLDTARDALRAAVRAAPEAWRAHYYLGRVYRDLDDARPAAVQFTATIKTHPGHRAAYIALIELYRRWDYVDQALAVALLGTGLLPAAEAGELWFEAGMAYDAKRADAKAIDAFSRAIAGRPDDNDSKFQRGQIYLRKGDVANARRDLEDVARSPDGKLGVVKQLATQLLAQLGSKGAQPARRAPAWDCRRRSSGTSIVCRPR
jgi:tetratricopeptide (TPR) repeat protein